MWQVKIALLIPSLSRMAGGMFDSARWLAKSLQSEQQAHVEILSFDDGVSEQDLSFWQPLVVRCFVARGPASFRFAPALAEKLCGSDFDIVHVQGLWTYLSLAATKWAAKTRRPYLVTPHGMLDPWAIKHSSWKKQIAFWLFERRHLLSAGCIHAVSGGEALAIRELGLRNPICIIPNGVEIPGMDSDRLQAPWNGEFVAGRKVLLYLGRLHPKKGLQTFLRAWQRARSEKDKWVFVIGGWDQGGHRSDLEQLVNELAISNSVKFLGPLFDAKRGAAYRHASAFVLPSLSEGQPLTVLEAWSHALPVLMTGECNLGEGFEAGAAIRMEPTVESQVHALRALFSLSDAALREMGHRGGELVLANFSWSQSASQMSRVYQWLLGRSAPPDCVITD